MMKRTTGAWEDHSFKGIIVKVANLEIYHWSLNFYLHCWISGCFHVHIHDRESQDAGVALKESIENSELIT